MGKAFKCDRCMKLCTGEPTWLTRRQLTVLRVTWWWDTQEFCDDCVDELEEKINEWYGAYESGLTASK